jgi:hypothetical protein
VAADPKLLNKGRPVTAVGSCGHGVVTSWSQTIRNGAPTAGTARMVEIAFALVRAHMRHPAAPFVTRGAGVQVPPRPPPLTCGFVFGKVPHPVAEPTDCNPIATLRSAQRCDTRHHPPASGDLPSTRGHPRVADSPLPSVSRQPAPLRPAGVASPERTRELGCTYSR